MVVGLQQVYAQETTLKDDLSTLPNELLEKIFNQLDSKEKLELAKTNKILRSFVDAKRVEKTEFQFIGIPLKTINETLQFYKGEQLKKLVIQGTDLSTFNINFLKSCPKLQEIKLVDTNLNTQQLNTFFTMLPTFKNLQILDITDNVLSTISTELLNKLPETLEYLNLSGCRLEAEPLITLFKKLTTFKNLKRLDLSYNYLSAIPEDLFKNLPETLQDLNLLDCYLRTGQLTILFEKLATFKNLKKLNLSQDVLSTISTELLNKLPVLVLT